MKRKPARTISLIASLITLLIGILAIIGCFMHNNLLGSNVAVEAKMKFNTALCFIFSSIVLLLFLFPQKNKTWRKVSIFLSGTVSLIGVLTLLEYIFHLNLGIDELFCPDDVRTSSTYHAGRMSPITAANFVLIGIGLLLLNKKKAVAFQLFYLLPVSFVSLLMLICFNFIADISLFFRFAIFVAISFITLSAAIYYAQPVIQKKITFQTKLILGFVAAITLVVIISIISSYYNDRREYSSRVVEHTNKVLDEASEALSLSKDIESGSRAYVITGDSSHLDHFIAAKAAIFNHIRELKKLTADNNLQQKRIDSLQKLIYNRIDISEKSVHLRNEKGLNEATKWMATSHGKYYTDSIRYFTYQIKKEENNLLIGREEKNKKTVAAFNQAFYTLFAAMTALLVYIFGIIFYNFKRRKKAERKSKENEEQIETMFRAAPDAVIAINSQGRILRWNTKAEILFGWNAPEVTGKLLAETIIPHRYREAHKTGMEHFLKTGEAQVLGKTIEIQGLKKDNTELDIALSISPTIVKNQYLFIGFIHDITDKKKAENEIKELNASLEQRVIERTEELHESEQKYRYLFESNPLPMWIIDINTFQFLNVNDAAIIHYGYSREEFLSMTALNIRPENEKQKFILLERSPDSAVRDRGNWKHRKKDGSIIDVEIITHKIIYEGSMARFILSNDITEKVKAEEKLAYEKQLLRTLIDILPDYIYFKDTESRHLVNNKANIQLIGASNEEETIGKSVIDFFGAEVAKSFIADDKLVIKTGASVTSMEEIIDSATGKTKYLLTTKVPVKDKNHKVTGLVGISRDITKQKEVELELQNSKYFLEKAQKVGQIGHWISNRKAGKLTWSEEACNIFGIDYRDFDGKIGTFLNRVHPDDLEKVNSATALAIENNQPYSIDHRILLSDGTIKWVNEQGETIFDERGKAAMLMGIVQDITERKLVEENLKNSLKEISDYKYALDESSIVAITDQKGIIKYANDNFCKISKYSADELFGQDHRIVNSGYQTKEFIRDLWATVANGKIWRGELKNRAKDGTMYWVDTTIVPFLNKEGKPYQYTAITADITERKQAEDDLRESQELLQAIIENSTAVIYVKNLQGQYLLINRRFSELFHVSREDILGKTDYDFFPKEMADSFHSMDERVAAADHALTEEEVAPLDDGLHTYISVKSTLKDSAGKPYAVFGISTDITSEKRAEEKIKQSEKIYKTIASHIPGSLICLFDPEYRYLLIEGDLLEKLGYSKEALLGKKAADVFPPERFALLLPDLIRVFKGEIFTTEAISGGYDIVTRYVPLKNENNIVYAAMTVAIDVTQLQNAQRKIFELNIDLEKKIIDRTAQLEEVNKELEAFTYSVSHDLRAPLRIIDGFAGILLADFADKLNDEGNRTLQVIMNNAQRMGQLIDDLLNLSRLGRQDIRVNPVNMDKLVRVIVDEQLLLNNKQIKITYQQLLPSNCDNGLMRQVWVNLISNAIKYSGKVLHPQISIGSYKKDDHIVYFVKDNGIGFDMKYAGKLFGVFQRLHKITEFEGTGVGLALVQRIISKHNGKVWAYAEINKGATFYFSLPSS